MKNKIVNIYHSVKDKEQAHNGMGLLEKVRPYTSKDFKSPVDFLDYVIVPSNASIGMHTHGANEEVYFILKGEGTMIINHEGFKVCPGDIIVNSVEGTHGLINDSKQNMEIFIFQVSLTKEADTEQ